MQFSAEQIAAMLQGTLEGDAGVTVGGLSKIEEGQAGTAGQRGSTLARVRCRVLGLRKPALTGFPFARLPAPCSTRRACG